jgi:hypothetical protein
MASWSKSETRRFSALALAFTTLAVGTTACGGDDGSSNNNNTGAAGLGGSGGGGASSGGSAGSVPAAGSGGVGTGGQAEGNAGRAGADTGPPVPRFAGTDGPSVLDMPTLGLNDDGKCPRAEVFCSGMCLAAELQAAGKCTALKLGLGQTAAMALTADALFYTAANREILKMDLAQGTHTSLVRGLTFVEALAVDGDWLYFSTQTPDAFFQHDARRIALTGGDVTVISRQTTEPIEAIIPLADKLLLGIGNFELELRTIPKEGGEFAPFGGITDAKVPVLGGGSLYYRSTDGLCATSISAPMPEQCLNQEFANARLILEGDYLYYALDDAYMRQPIAGGVPEAVQPLVDTAVWGRTPTQVVLGRVDPSDEKVTQVLVMPIAGGTPQELTTIESQELRAVVADAENLYLAVGVVAGGAILRVPLSP